MLRTALLILLAALAFPALCQTTVRAVDPDSSEARQAQGQLEALGHVSWLVHYGRSQQNPLALVTAANILMQTGALGPGRGGEASQLPEPATLLQEARPMCGEDRAMLRLAAPPSDRGVDIGVTTTWQGAYAVAPDRPLLVDRACRGRRRYLVVAQPDAGSIELGVVGEDNRQIGWVSSRAVEWTAAHDATYAICVRNLGRAPVQVRLLVRES